MIQIGAYVPGSDPRVDAARALQPAIDALLRQSPEDKTSRGTREMLRRTSIPG